MTKLSLGVDIGGVIIDRVNDITDTSFFGDNYLQTRAVRGAFEALNLLRRKFSKNIYLVSKCGMVIQQKTIDWLEFHNIYLQTGIRHCDVYFCRERQEKTIICKRFGITHFIDDRLEVLSYLTTVGTRYLFQPRLEEVEEFKHHLPSVKQVNSWQEILNQELPE